MNKKKLLHLIPFLAISLTLSACGTSSGSSGQESSGKASNWMESLISEVDESMTEHTTDTSADTSLEESKDASTEDTEAEEVTPETDELVQQSETQQSEAQQPQTDQQLSRINYYDSSGKMIYYESYAYYNNGLLCSTTLHSIDHYGEELQDAYTGNEYTFLYLYDENGNLKTTQFGSLTIPGEYDDTTGCFNLGYDEETSEELCIYPKEESIEQEKFHVDPSRTEKVYGEAPVIPTHAENGWASSYLNEIFSGQAPTDMVKARFLDVNDDGQPELWMDYGYGYAGGEVFATDGSTTDKVYLSHGAAYTIPGSNVLWTMGGHMGGYYDEFYKVENGKFVSIAKGSYGDAENQRTDENGNPVYDYYWNDESVTEETYEQNKKEIFDKDTTGDAFQNIYTFEQCRTLLQEIAGA